MPMFMRVLLSPRNLYWSVRHAIWDWRERYLVREIARKMARCEALYVHEHNGDTASWVVLQISDVLDVPSNHDHIEGGPE